MIDIYVNDIKKSLENNCYFSALALALTLPDICGMVEFPNETSIAKRYIEWYDKYLGIFMSQGKNVNGVENPWLSGEIIYNLRNTYLHTGSPNVMGDKVKEEANQIDRFILVLGDGTAIWDSTIAIDFGHGKVKFKAIIVDVTYLCNNICNCALCFYDNNREKFQFDFNAITQEEFLKQPTDNAMEGDILAKILNKKLFESGSTMRVIENPSHNILNSSKKGLNIIFSDEETKERFLNGESIFAFSESSGMRKELQIAVPKIEHEESKKLEPKQKVRKNIRSKKNVSKEKREAQVRCFFGQHFKNTIYSKKKEEIIQAVLKSKTKQQLNNKLMKNFSSKETGIIFKKLQPIIKDLPGK